MTNSDPNAITKNLDDLTSGAFSAVTSNERIAAICAWLQQDPSADLLHEVFKEMSVRDKGASKPIKERIDELKQAKNQETLGQEWFMKGQKLLASDKLNIADALAWQRDAAKSGAPLAKEPLASVKEQLSVRVRHIEELQQSIQIQAEVAVLLVQRIEVLSTKPWQDAFKAQEAIDRDITRWQNQSEKLTSDADMASVAIKFTPLLASSKSQLLAMWDAFKSAVQQADEASQDPQKPMPPIRGWAEEIAATRVPSEVATEQNAPNTQVANSEQQGEVRTLVRGLVAQLEGELAQGHSKVGLNLSQQLRHALKEHARLLDDKLKDMVHAALAKAGELSDWQRWRADQLRQSLVARAEELLRLQKEETTAPTPTRKLQETLKELREQWRQTDQGGTPNQALWKRFDEACTEVHKVVGAWQEHVKGEVEENKAVRLELIAQLRTFTQQQQAENKVPDWKEVIHRLRDFSDKWRKAGHVGDKLFTELDASWKEVLAILQTPLKALQAANTATRHELIEAAKQISEKESFTLDEVRFLQESWKLAAQKISLDRKTEQKLWSSFREHMDQAFTKRDKNRQQAKENKLSNRDKAVLAASEALKATCQKQDARLIQEALNELNRVLQAENPGQMPVPASASDNAVIGVASDVVLATNSNAEQTIAVESSEALELVVSSQEPVVAPVVVPKMVIARRGDDRPGMKKESTPVAIDRRNNMGRDGRNIKSSDKGSQRASDNAARTFAPRLDESVFRAQKEAIDEARAALRKCSQKAHGQVLDTLKEVYEKRAADLLPSVQQFACKSVNASTRALWLSALNGGAPAALDSETALLRLEIAAQVPTPLVFQEQRRKLQLLLLTRRHDPSPQETWTQDVASVLCIPATNEISERLTQALKHLMK